VENQPPIAIAKVVNETGQEGVSAVADKNTNITFIGGYSYDPDGTIVNYTWDFGDGTFAYDANTTHSYSQAGTYTAILTVTDNNGAINSSSVTVSIKESGNGQIEIVNSPPEVKTATMDKTQYLKDETVIVTGRIYDANWETDVVSITAIVTNETGTMVITIDNSLIAKDLGAKDGYLNYSFEIQIGTNWQLGTYTINVTAVDKSDESGYKTVTFEVIEEIPPLPPIEISYTGELDYLDFGEIKAGASNVNSTNAFIVCNNQNHSVDVWFDISNFTNSSTYDKIPTVGNMKIWIWDGSAYSTSIDYDSVDTYLGTIAAGGSMQIKLEILNVPEPIKTGVYKTTFGVYEG